MLAIKVTWRERSLRGFYIYLVGFDLASGLCFTHLILDLINGGYDSHTTRLRKN